MAVELFVGRWILFGCVSAISSAIAARMSAVALRARRCVAFPFDHFHDILLGFGKLVGQPNFYWRPNKSTDPLCELLCVGINVCLSFKIKNYYFKPHQSFLLIMSTLVIRYEGT